MTIYDFIIATRKTAMHPFGPGGDFLRSGGVFSVPSTFNHAFNMIWAYGAMRGELEELASATEENWMSELGDVLWYAARVVDWGVLFFQDRGNIPERSTLKESIDDLSFVLNEERWKVPDIIAKGIRGDRSLDLFMRELVARAFDVINSLSSSYNEDEIKRVLISCIEKTYSRLDRGVIKGCGDSR